MARFASGLGLGNISYERKDAGGNITRFEPLNGEGLDIHREYDPFYRSACILVMGAAENSVMLRAKGKTRRASVVLYLTCRKHT